MVSVVQVPTTVTLRRIHQVQAITIVWMIVEACVSLSAAWMARSPAMLAFGGDSSWIALLGIGLNAVWHIGWADGAAALIIVPLMVREGFQSMRTRMRLLLSVPCP